MSEAAASCATGRSTLDYFRRAAAIRGEMAGDCVGELGLAPCQRSATPLESCSARELRTPEVTNDRADHGIIARPLLISNDRSLMPEQLRRAFPGPTRVQVAGTGRVGLEHVRADSPDVIVLDLGLPDQSGMEVYRQFRRISERVPVIVVTRARQSEAAIEAISGGVSPQEGEKHGSA